MIDGALFLENHSDYVLKEGEESVWVTVGNLSVYIIRTDEGVVVDIYPLHDELSECLASTYAFAAEGEPDA